MKAAYEAAYVYDESDPKRPWFVLCRACIETGPITGVLGKNLDNTRWRCVRCGTESTQRVPQESLVEQKRYRELLDKAEQQDLIKAREVAYRLARQLNKAPISFGFRITSAEDIQLALSWEPESTAGG